MKWKNCKRLIQFALGKNHFEEEYLVFQSMGRYFKRLSGVGTVNYIYFCKSKWLSNENIAASTTSDYGLISQISYLGNKTTQYNLKRKLFKARWNYIYLWKNSKSLHYSWDK